VEILSNDASDVFQLDRYDGRRFQAARETGSRENLGRDPVYSGAREWRYLAGRVVASRTGAFSKQAIQPNRRTGWIQWAAAFFAFTNVRLVSILFGDRDRLILSTMGKKWTILRSHLDRVNAIYTERDGTMWVASGTGLHRYQKRFLGNLHGGRRFAGVFYYAFFQDRRDVFGREPHKV
jgi:hypothetical protein